MFWQSVLQTKQFPSVNTISLEMNVVNECVQLPPGHGVYTQTLFGPGPSQFSCIEVQNSCTEIAKFKAFSFKCYHFLFVLLHLSYLLL